MPRAKKPVKIADVIHVYGKIRVAILHLLKPLKKGDSVHFKGHTTDFTQAVKSMQIEHETVETAKKGDDIGLKVDKDVRVGDEVFEPEEE